jgi:phosphate transport system permease protein
MNPTPLNRQHRIFDTIFRWVALLFALLVLLLMKGIFVQLVVNSLPTIRRFGFGFITSSAWDPAITKTFGAASSIFGTLVSTVIAMVFAVPLSIVIALFLVELAHPILGKFVGYAIELLAAIPSIIYGMWGLFVFAPFMEKYLQVPLNAKFGFIPLFSGAPMGIGMLTAGIILALMVLPFVSAVMRDVFLMVPGVVKEAAFGMGSTTWEATLRVTVRYGIQGLIGAAFLGLGRAIGETMAVTFVIGNVHTISASLLAPGNSIASTLANEFAEASDPLYMSALVELGLILFGITLLIQLAAHVWLGRIRKSMGGGL